jgi:hypothetical protein
VSELENTFLDRFLSFVRSHGNLPAGTVILIGLISHLQSRGLSDYAECLVESMRTLPGKIGSGVEVVPLVNLPLDGIDSPALIRSLLDFESWLGMVTSGSVHSLPQTRECFWFTLTQGKNLQAYTATESFVTMLPVGLKNVRKKPFTSDPFSKPLPQLIPPITESQEGAVLATLLGEINESFGLKLDTNPKTERLNMPTLSSDVGRTVVVGASHAGRVADALEAGGSEVAYLGKPGWSPNETDLAASEASITALKLAKGDIMILDLWSNSAYMGTDEMGLPCKAFKSGDDNKYHITGQLQAAPKPVFQKILKDAIPLIGAADEASVVLLSPLPRYVMGRCCNDGGHITNLESEEFDSEIQRADDNAALAVGAALQAENVIYFGFKDLFGYDKDLSDMATGSGAPIWRLEDPVHLTEEGYAELGAAMIAAARKNEQPVPRVRLESVVPGVRGGQKKARVIRPTPWVSGMSDAGRGRGGPSNGGGCGGFFRGGRGGLGGRWNRGQNRGWGYRPY